MDNFKGINALNFNIIKPKCRNDSKQLVLDKTTLGKFDMRFRILDCNEQLMNMQ